MAQPTTPKGTTALVTGVGNRVAAATARQLIGSGHTVFVADGSKTAAAAVADSLANSEVDVHPLQLDVTSEAGWQSVIEACSTAGGLRLLVNADQRFAAGSVIETNQDGFNTQLVRNALGCWLGQKYAIETMAAGTGGAIINVTSVLALAAVANCAAYCAAARGILMSTKSAALECARDGFDIVVNAVLAGAIEGDNEHFPNAAMLNGAPTVTPDEVASGVMFLATDGGAYMTGTGLPVDGGWLAQ